MHLVVVSLAGSNQKVGKIFVQLSQCEIALSVLSYLYAAKVVTRHDMEKKAVPLPARWQVNEDVIKLLVAANAAVRESRNVHASRY